jgi:hypothetical protein
MFPGTREWQRVVVVHHAKAIGTGVRHAFEPIVQEEVSAAMEKTFGFFREIRDHRMKAH